MLTKFSDWCKYNPKVGDFLLRHKDARQVLGQSFLVNRKEQCKVIKDMLDKGFLFKECSNWYKVKK